MATIAPETKLLINQALETYLTGSAATSPRTLKDFVEKNKNFVLTKCNTSNLRRFWTKSFRDATENFDIQDVDHSMEPDWTQLTMEKLEMVMTMKASSTESHSTKTSTTSHCLSSEQWEAFKGAYRAMENDKKWKLDEGVYVEDVMYNYGMTCTSEQSVHSFVLDLEEEWVHTKFTETQIQYMKRFNIRQLPKLPESLDHFFDKFTDIMTFEEWVEKVRSVASEDMSIFNVDWARRSLDDLLTSYQYNKISSVAQQSSEKDIIIRIWRMIDVMFDDLSGVYASRSDHASTAMTERVNKKRKMSASGLAQRERAWKPDLLVAKDAVEYACSEHGGKEEAGAGTKELYTKFLKMPKLLKDMFNHAAKKLDWEEELVHKLRIVGLMHTHLRIHVVTADSPAGYVVRLSRTNDYEVPTDKKRIYHDLLPIMRLLLKVKMIVGENLDLVTRGPQQKSQDPDLSCFEEQRGAIFPDALPQTDTKKKAKTTAFEN